MYVEYDMYSTVFGVEYVCMYIHTHVSGAAHAYGCCDAVCNDGSVALPRSHPIR